MDENWKERASEETDKALFNSLLEKHLVEIVYAKTQDDLVRKLMKLSNVILNKSRAGVTATDPDVFIDSVEFLIKRLFIEKSHQARRDILLNALERCGLEEDSVKRLKEI